MISKLRLKINGKIIEFKYHELIQIAINFMQEQNWSISDTGQDPIGNTIILSQNSAQIAFDGKIAETEFGYPYTQQLDEALSKEYFKASTSREQGPISSVTHRIVNEILGERDLPRILTAEMYQKFFDFFKAPAFFMAEKIDFMDPFLYMPPHVGDLVTLQKYSYAANYFERQFLHQDIEGWWVEISGRLLLVKNTKKYAFYVSDHGSLSDIILDLKELVFVFPWTNPYEVKLLVEAQKKIESLSQEQELLIKKQDELIRGTMEEYLERIRQFSKGASLDEINDDQLALAKEDELDPRTAVITYWSDGIRAMKYVIDILARRLCSMKFQKEPADDLPFLGQDEDFEHYVHSLFEENEYTQADKIVRTFVLMSIAKQVAIGQHEPLFRPMHSYGDADKGAPYHAFARSVVSFQEKNPGVSDVQIVEIMRNILSKKSVDNKRFGFLINIVGAWFIAEQARNNLSILSSIMLLDMIQNERKLIADDTNIYTLKYALIHPLNENPDAEIKDLCGKKTKPRKIGGSHPMAHEGSSKQAKLKIDGKFSSLDVARQKEGRLLTDWLLMQLNYLFSDDDNINVEAVTTDDPLKSDMVFNEISFYRKRSSKLNKKKGGDQEVLALKQAIQWYLIEPLLKERMATVSLMPNINPSLQLNSIKKKFYNALEDNKLKTFNPDFSHFRGRSIGVLSLTKNESKNILYQALLEAIRLFNRNNSLTNLIADVQRQLKNKLAKEYDIDVLCDIAAQYIAINYKQFEEISMILNGEKPIDYIEQLFREKPIVNGVLLKAFSRALQINIHVANIDGGSCTYGVDHADNPPTLHFDSIETDKPAKESNITGEVSKQSTCTAAAPRSNGIFAQQCHTTSLAQNISLNEPGEKLSGLSVGFFPANETISSELSNQFSDFSNFFDKEQKRNLKGFYSAAKNLLETLIINGDEGGDVALLECVVNSLTNKGTNIKQFVISKEGAIEYREYIINLINQIQQSQRQLAPQSPVTLFTGL